MNVLSLFDGISCGQLALQRAGIKVDNYFASEIEKESIKVTMDNFPNTIQLGDVNNWRRWKLPKIDLVLAGSPCQGFSRNGKMLNFEDPRSKLFFVFVDIVNHLKKQNPDLLFILENVKMKWEWANLITEYTGVPCMEINSKLVSAQHRLRMYWTNIPNVELPEDKGIKLLDIIDRDYEVEYRDVKGIKIENKFGADTDKIINVVDGELRISQATKQGWISANNGDGVNVSFPNSTTRRGRVINQKSATLGCKCDVAVYYDGKIREFSVNELEQLQTLPIGYTKATTPYCAKRAIGNGWTVDVITHILSYIKKEDH